MEVVYVITWYAIKFDPNKVKGVIGLGIPTTNNYVQAIIGVLQYYRDLCMRGYHILAIMTEVDGIPKGIKCYRYIILK